MEQLFKMPKQQEMPRNNRAMFATRPRPPSSGTIKPYHNPSKPYYGRSKPVHNPSKPAFYQTGIDLHALLRSRHTKETIHRGKHGPDMGHAANLFSNDHHAGGMGAVKGGHHVGHGMLKVNQKFTYKNHMGNQVKVPTGWEVDNFGSAYDPTKPHPL